MENNEYDREELWQSLFLANKDEAAYEAYADEFDCEIEIAKVKVQTWWAQESAWFYSPL